MFLEASMEALSMGIEEMSVSPSSPVSELQGESKGSEECV